MVNRNNNRLVRPTVAWIAFIFIGAAVSACHGGSGPHELLPVAKATSRPRFVMLATPVPTTAPNACWVSPTANPQGNSDMAHANCALQPNSTYTFPVGTFQAEAWAQGGSYTCSP